MNDKDLNKVHVASADLESMEFERDHAAMDLDDAVDTAVQHGESVEDIARVANMPAEEVTKHLSTDPTAEGSADREAAEEA